MGLPEVQGHSSGLIAVLLITRSRPGPKLVFHYPAKRQSTKEERDANDSDLESDEEPDVRGGDDGRRIEDGTASVIVSARLGEISPKVQDDGGSDKVLGYRVDSLEKLLSPGRWSDRRKFEVCVDGITFVGLPIYSDEDGRWSKKQADRSMHGDVAGGRIATQKEHRMHNTDAASTSPTLVTSTASDAPENSTHDFAHIPESLDSQPGLSFATSMTTTSTASGDVREQMTMFHVVFAFRSDHQSEVPDVYEHVTRKLSKALHYCQKQTNYVAAESTRLLALRAKAKQTQIGTDALWTRMLESNELAWTLKEVYERISAGQVAGIRLDGYELALQVPPARSTTYGSHGELSPHSGLLLLEDKDVLFRALSHPEASPMAYFIREHTPTKSLQKLSTSLNLPINDLMYLAQHLMKWRKAKGIAPLHPRNIYTTLPGAPTDKVPVLMQVYGRKFAALPSLPQMLKLLSGKPIQYGLLIPSKDHRTSYMEILAFLVRHGLVAQLKTYGWLRAQPLRDTRAEHITVERPKYPASGVSLLSPQLRPVEDDEASVSSERTAVPVLTTRSAEPTSDDTGLRHGVVRDPLLATDGEAVVLAHIQGSVVGSELQERHSRLLLYLDGEHAFEDIAAEENLKRAAVEEWLGTLSRSGHLLTFRSL
ncbi:hypothetical protein LTR08_002298 [Meristemomyces frigidus]|nr:hypothetical protein LTR08_002298 [Meristemomyces frigidus]